MVAHQRYQTNQVVGAGPLGLILLTYGALLKSLGQAKNAIMHHNIQEEVYYTSRALEAIIELSSSLDHKQGGEIASHLSQLYAYLSQRLSDDMCSSSSRAIDEAMQITQSLLDGWQHIEGVQKHTALMSHSNPANAYASY